MNGEAVICLLMCPLLGMSAGMSLMAGFYIEAIWMFALSFGCAWYVWFDQREARRLAQRELAGERECRHGWMDAALNPRKDQK